jgi:hypothetical protein
MAPPVSRLFCLSLLAMVPATAAFADDTWLLKGEPDAAIVKNLKGGSANDAAVVPVFHGRFCGCCWRRALCCCEPVCCNPCVVSCCPPCGPVGYAYAAPAYAPATAYSYSPPSYAPTNEAPAYIPTPTRAVVTLPRLGLSFTVGSGNGFLANRSTLGNDLSGMMRPADEQRALPRAETRPDQFRYDGGPSSPIPLPGARTQPLPTEPTTAPALNNRVKASPSKPTWLAYGEQPKQLPSNAPRTLLVNGGGR